MGFFTLFKIARRSVLRHRRRTLISVSAVGFSLGLAIFFITLGDGVYRQLIEDAVRLHGGHLTVEDPMYEEAPAVDLRVRGIEQLRHQVEALPNVERTKAMVLGQGVAKSGAAAVGVAIMGVEPAVEKATSPLARRMQKGQYLEDPDEPRIVVGSRLAERLKVGLGSKLVLATNNAAGDLVEELVRVKGIFSMGTEETDAYLAQIPIGTARRLFGLEPDAATRLAVVLTDAREREPVLQAVQALAPPGAEAKPWEEVLPDLAAYIRIDRGSNLILQGILIFLSLFTVFNTVSMSVLERTREFAVQLAIGTRLAALAAQVLLESAVMGLVGCLFGIVLGGSVGFYFERHGLDIRTFYSEEVTVSGFAMDTVIRAYVSLERLASLGGLVFLATVAVGVIPLFGLRRIRVADVLR